LTITGGDDAYKDSIKIGSHHRPVSKMAVKFF